jgi:hypothetical protein
MRFEKLFDDLEGQLDQELGAEAVDLEAEEERLRLGRLGLRERLRALGEAQTDAVRIVLRGGDSVSMTIASVGRDWAAGRLEAGERREALLPLSGIASIVLPRRQLPPSIPGGDPEGDRSLAAKLTLSFVLRDLCRRRRTVDLRCDGFQVTGTIDRVGRDHLDLAVHAMGEARRERAVAQWRIVPFEQLVLVRY